MLFHLLPKKMLSYWHNPPFICRGCYLHVPCHRWKCYQLRKLLFFLYFLSSGMEWVGFLVSWRFLCQIQHTIIHSEVRRSHDVKEKEKHILWWKRKWNLLYKINKTQRRLQETKILEIMIQKGLSRLIE